MKRALYNLGKQTALTATMLLLVFAPFQTLVAQAAFTSLPSCAAGVTVSDGTCIVQGQAAAAPSATPNTAPSSDVNDPLLACGITQPSACIKAIIYVFTIGIGSVFAYVAAYFFDITIQLSLNGASYGLDFISTSWTTARDLGNMAFLFILLYIAFTIIFRADTSSTKTMLALVIVVALLVNFSFFFSRVIIDAGNILSIQFYNAIPAPPISQTIQGSNAVTSAVASVSSSIGGTQGGTKDLTAGIMNMLNIQGLLNNNSFSATKGNFIATVLIYIAGAIVLWLLTIAFITNGIKFLVRVVVLWFLIIASPLALISITVQGTGGYFKQWREMLLQHAFYPVAFMFVFLVLNNFAVTMANSSMLTGGVFTTLQTSDASSFGAIGASLVALGIRLALIIAVLYVGMKASDSISVKGSKAAGAVGGWFGDKYKNTFRGSANLANKYVPFSPGRATAWADNKLKNSVIGNGLLGYEFRRYVSKPAAARLGSVGGGFETVSEMKDRRKKEGAEKAANIRGIDNKESDTENNKKVEEIGKQIADNIKANLKPIAGISDDDKKKIQSLNKREIEAMNAEQIEKISALLTEDQMKRVKEMEKLTDKEKEKIDSHWNEHSTAAPVHKASKALNDLSKVNNRLAHPDADITRNTLTNTPVNKLLLEDITEKIDTRLDEAKTNHIAATKSLELLLEKKINNTATQAQVDVAKNQLNSAETELRNLNKMSAHIKTADEQRGKVQPHHGDIPAAGEFKIKAA